MNNWRIIGVGAALILTGCGPATPAATNVPPSPSESASAFASATPIPASAFPQRFPVRGSLTEGNAAKVVAELHRVAGGLPILKLDITAEQATLTALLPDESVASYSWRDGQINPVESDLQYLGQTAFDPSAFPLDSLGRMFDIADLRGVRGELVLQIVEYREGLVLMTVTSRPESGTVFFRQDGTAVAELGYSGVNDITAGFEEVLTDATAAYAVGFNPSRGYWADLPDDEGVVLSRSRLGGLPSFETRRAESPVLTPFDPALIDPAAIAKAVAKVQTDPSRDCDVTIDMSTQRSAPVAKISCGSGTFWFDLEGRDMTTLID